MSRETILDYFSSFYHPGNMVVSIAGNASQEEVNRAVEGFFKEKKPVRRRHSSLLTPKPKGRS